VQAAGAVISAVAALTMLEGCGSDTSQADPRAPHTTAASPKAAPTPTSPSAKPAPKQEKASKQWEFDKYPHRDGFADCNANRSVNVGLTCTAERSGIFFIGKTATPGSTHYVKAGETFNLTYPEKKLRAGTTICKSLPLTFVEPGTSRSQIFDSLDTCEPRLLPPYDGPVKPKQFPVELPKKLHPMIDDCDGPAQDPGVWSLPEYKSPADPQICPDGVQPGVHGR
jgi:hypothetical protein